MLRRKTLKNLTRLWTGSLAPLLPKPRRAKAVKKVARTVAKTVVKKKAAPAKPISAAGARADAGRWLWGVAVAPGGRRRYRLFLPAGRLPGQRIPVMVMLHGCDQNAARFAASTRMHQIAARAGFAVLYPEQDRLANANGCWNWHETRSGRAYAEAGMILQAVDQVCTLYGGDRARVAIAGLSAGAGMAALVAARHPDRFCAVAMHSGVPPGTAHSTLSAMTAMAGRRETGALDVVPEHLVAQWPPLLVIQGGQDRVVAPRNGQAAVQAWAAATGAVASAPREVQRGRRYPMEVTDYRARRRTLATLVHVPSLAHAWSGGAASQAYGDPQGPDASRLIWAFAQRAFAPSP